MLYSKRPVCTLSIYIYSIYNTGCLTDSIRFKSESKSKSESQRNTGGSDASLHITFISGALPTLHTRLALLKAGWVRGGRKEEKIEGEKVNRKEYIHNEGQRKKKTIKEACTV